MSLQMKRYIWGYPIVAHSLDELSNNNHYVYFIAMEIMKNEKKWYFDKLKERNCELLM